MTSKTSTLQQLVDWLQQARLSVPFIDNEADGLLHNMAALQQRQIQIDLQAEQPLTLGLYGHSVDGKHHLLTTLLGDNFQRIEILLGGKVLDYLTHINPGHAASVAVRFTRRELPVAEHYPLLLTLCNASELAQRLIRQYHATSAARFAQPQAIDARLRELRTKRLAQPNPAITQLQLSDIAQAYHQVVRRQYHLGSALWQQMAELMPWLNSADQAALLAPLWGDNATSTAQWQHLAEMLNHLGYARQVLAPANLLVDTFLLPVEGFLFPTTPDVVEINADVLVCPLFNQEIATQVSLSLLDLQQLCAEITLTLNHLPQLPHVDVVDIPLLQLDDYAQYLQPDKLVVCNAASERSEVNAAGKMLARWVDKTQASNATTPGLIWAITPRDARFSGANLDEGVQRIIGLPGKRWGTLQALDSRNMHRLLGWLTDALVPAQRTLRIEMLQAALNTKISALFAHLLDGENLTPERARSQAEDLVRTLQTRAASHGELLASLLPERHVLQQSWLSHQQLRKQQPAGFSLDIDLFADEESHSPQTAGIDSFASVVHLLWINHLRQLAARREIAELCGLDNTQLQALCQLLIIASYRLKLSEQLDTALHHGDGSMAQEITCVSAVLGDFVSWLGYAHIEPALRPASRVNKGSPVFTPQAQATASTRLVRLGDQPARGNTLYVYDWLVALYTRALENIGYRHPLDVSEQQRQQLRELLV
ncbi:putative virulence factor [Buttiauxella ferragutiae ATCC 51602]|uniref:Virulence factor n=1 Tax=Buttiauxella ferragutiae ATCC 51602 TaxID=1354252 RepID=A0ABX2W5H5_9ENTR|nr:virulence factor SrfC family protein [Buttiauxella ferragutiae]OAT26035.1 putative virulence factor [Buttiauxella ferragutiae ATCC 51602]